MREHERGGSAEQHMEELEAQSDGSGIDEFIVEHDRARTAGLAEQHMEELAESRVTDEIMREYNRAERLMDFEGDPFDNLLKESFFGLVEDCDKENAVRLEKREWRESVNNSLFRVVAQVGRSRTYSFENLLQAAAALAENCLRRHVTLPGNPDDPNEPIILHDGVLLPSCSCAFKGCLWEYTSVNQRESQDDHLYIQHP